MNVLSIGKTAYDITIPVDAYPQENSKKLLKERLEYSGGPACNVALLLNKWNCETYFAAVLGYDDYGTAIKKELENENIRTSYLETNYEKKTTMNIILVNKSTTSRTIMAIEPDISHIKKTEFNETYDIIYSDGFEYSASIAAFNKNQNAVTLLAASLDNGSDPKEVLALAKHVKYITFSLDFAEKLTKLKADFNNSLTLLNLYKELKEKFPEQTIVVTLKNMGAMYQVNSEVKVMPTISVSEVDRTGSGDIFDGALCYGLGKGYDIEKCIRLANIAAGLSTTKYGVKSAMPLLSDVINYYEQRFGPLETNQQQQYTTQTVTQQPNPMPTNQNDVRLQ